MDSGVTMADVTRGGNWWRRPIFSRKKLTTFFSHRLWKVMTFLAVVSSPLPSSHVVNPVLFVNSA